MPYSPGHDEGAAAWARIATLTDTAKMNGLNPHAHLKATLEATANGHPTLQIDQLQPGALRQSPAESQVVPTLRLPILGVDTNMSWHSYQSLGRSPSAKWSDSSERSIMGQAHASCVLQRMVGERTTHRTAPQMGASNRLCCKKPSHSTDACDRSVLSGIAGTNPVILFAPCFVLADDAGTALALFLWSVERLRRVARHPYRLAVCRESRRLVGLPCGLPDSRSGRVSRDVAEKAAAGGCTR